MHDKDSLFVRTNVTMDPWKTSVPTVPYSSTAQIWATIKQVFISKILTNTVIHYNLTVQEM